MLQMNVSKLFWTNKVLTAAYLLNRMLFCILKGKSPFEMFFLGKNPFSVPPRVHNHSPNCDKLDPRAHKYIFLGYSRTHKGYRCYSPSLRKHFVSADVTFFEDILYYFPKEGQLQESILSTPVIPTHVPTVPPTLPIPIVPYVPLISQIYVRQRNQGVPLLPPPPPIEFSLPLPPSASTSTNSPPPQSTSDLDLPILPFVRVNALALIILSLTLFPLIICLLLLKYFLYQYHHLFLSPTGKPFLTLVGVRQ